jgi:Cu-Zn family superoxide dismutase
MAMFAPRLQMSDLVGRSVIGHTGGASYSNEPGPLGGDGARVTCGAISVEALV